MRPIYTALKPRELLLFAETVRAIVGASDCPFQSSKLRLAYMLNLMRLLLRPFAQSKSQTTGLLAAFGITGRHRARLAALDRIIALLCPRRWRYVASGFARK
jgi:hypothetical protein